MELNAIAPNLWIVTQPFRFVGLEIGSCMTVIRLPSGDLVIISPINLNESLQQQILALGTVRYLIAPNLFHHLSIGVAKTLFPKATVIGVPGLPEKRPDLVIDGLLAESGEFESVLSYHPIQGFAAFIPPKIQLANEVVFFHRPSQTLIITDLAFNFDQYSDGLVRLLAKAIGNYQVLRPTFLEKWGTRNKRAVETSIRQLLEWDFERIIPGHGSMIEADAKARFIEGYEWFLDHPLSAS